VDILLALAYVFLLCLFISLAFARGGKDMETVNQFISLTHFISPYSQNIPKSFILFFILYIHIPSFLIAGDSIISLPSLRILKISI